MSRVVGCWASCLAAIVLLGACAEEPPPLRVGLLVWPAYELPYLARAANELSPREVELVDFRSTADALRAYRQGLVDAVALTMGFATHLAAEDSSHRVVMVIDYSYGGDAIVARTGLPSLRALRGRQVGVEASVLGLHVLSRALETAGLSLDDVELVPVDVADHVETFSDPASTLAAVVTYEPARSRLLSAGHRELFNSRAIPREIVDVLLTRQQTIEARGPELTRLVDAWFRAQDRLREDPSASAAVMAPREGVTPAVFLASLDQLVLVSRAENLRLLGGGDSTLAATVRRLSELLVREGIIQRPADPGVLLTADVVRGTVR